MSAELEEQFGEFDFTNDNDRGANTLIEFIKYSPNIVALVNSIMPEIQELHDAQKDVYSTINIFESVGTQLDDIFGTLLNLERETGQTDDDYRADLLAQSSILSKSGEITTMKDMYRSLVNASIVSLFEYQPAAFQMQATVSSIPSDSELVKVRSTLENAKQGGNNMSLSITDSATPFTLARLISPQLNSNFGLNGEGFTDGGTLAQGF